MVTASSGGPNRATAASDGGVRFITVDALMRLVGLVEAGHVSGEQVITVLRPASAVADPVVALLSPPLWR